MQSVYTENEMSQFRAFQDNKQSSRQKMLDEQYNTALNDFSKITKFMIEKYNPRRIWQWGSLLNRRHFSEISDIDIALEGLASYDEYAAILADVTPMTQFPLDLIEMERIGKDNANHIQKYGRLVYERTTAPSLLTCSHYYEDSYYIRDI